MYLMMTLHDFCLQDRYKNIYGSQPPQEWSKSELSQLCQLDIRHLLLNYLYEAKNPFLYQSLASTCSSEDVHVPNRPSLPPSLLHRLNKQTSFDCLSLGHFLSWVCRTVCDETTVWIGDIDNTCMKFLMKGLTEGTREAKSCESSIPGSLHIELCFPIWQDKGMNYTYLTQVLQSSETNCISGLGFFDFQFTQEFEHLIEVLTNSKSLETLSLLECNSLSPESGQVLRKMLEKNATLKNFYFEFSGQSLTTNTELFTHLVAGLKCNRAIKITELEGFHIDTVGVKLLAELIMCNSSLEALRISQCENEVPSDDNIFDVIEALKCNNTLKNFRFADYVLTMPGLQLLATALTINTTLERLEYSKDIMSEKDISLLAERLWTSGVLHQLLTISIKRTVELFGEQGTIDALQHIMLEWKATVTVARKYYGLVLSLQCPVFCMLENIQDLVLLKV